MKHDFPYTLHDYLDRELAIYHGKAPEHIVIEKKREYKRLYARWYRKEYYARIRQITIQFERKELKELTGKAKSLGVRLSTYIKSCVEGKKEKAIELAVILPLLLSLRDIIEESIHEQSLVGLKEALSILESITTQLS